jgi:predicted nucleotidyltransferase
VVLFGSNARGSSRPESAIDVPAVLETLAGDYGDELERGLTAVYPVALRLGRRVSVKPLARDEDDRTLGASATRYRRGDDPGSVL